MGYAVSNKQVLNIEEAAYLTGLSESYLYKLTSTQQIPHYKPRGKLLAFDRTELEAWLKQNRITTVRELETKAANHVAGVK
ncbi:hypothetical protein VZ94_14705 [Methylocucumis oryzae]|uniref:Helix-turn-helix domain-containing protein n=2 Tax=Methylocucumis oryzae TaxID=1632867 RepID=A0A0F3IGJ8_9GAMM|nr:hypothetical protein VZ94_14705 [Methylocucumis oryzae]